MQYLKDESYYNNLYDLHTIETCLDYYWSLKKGFEKHRKHKDFKKFTKKQFDEDVHKVVSYTINAIKIERFRHKREAIKKWMDEDRQRQEKLDNATEPQNIYCPQCNTSMHSTMKELNDYMDEPLRVLFFFECPKCKKRKGVYDDGADRVTKPQLCPKCKKKVKVDAKKKGKILIWTITCSSCDYKEIDKYDPDKRDAEWKKKEGRDKLLLEKYRDDFCYSEKEGVEAVLHADQLKAFMDKHRVREKHKKEYDAVAKLKKLTVLELEKLLNKTISHQGYVKLAFTQPDMGKYVIVGFTIQDSNTSRQEYDSHNELRKLIQRALAGSNWRLMSEGVNYRLGYLQGRLKAYETEEDLLKLVKKNPKSNHDL